MRTLLTIWVGFFFAGLALAQEPLSFKGFELGAEREKFLAAFPKLDRPCTTVCHWSAASACRGHDYQECRKALSYGGVMPMSILVRFKDDKLVSVYLTFDTDRFRDLSVAMVERFGKPEKDEPSVVQNRAGASFDNRKLTWERGDAILTVTMRSGKIDQGTVSFVSFKYMKEEYEDHQKAVKSKAKEL
jgi:hypothetical protein